jgi:hypothetical protein
VASGFAVGNVDLVKAEDGLTAASRDEALVRNLPGFARFLPVAGLFHGQVLNTSSLARDAGVARMTVEGFLDSGLARAVKRPPVRSPPRNAVPCSRDGSRPRSGLTPISTAYATKFTIGLRPTPRRRKLISFSAREARNAGGYLLEEKLILYLQ